MGGVAQISDRRGRLIKPAFRLHVTIERAEIGSVEVRRPLIDVSGVSP
jgi:hypothetical protein